MNFYIEELPDGTAALTTEHGYHISTFSNIEDAKQACKEWYRLDEAPYEYDDDKHPDQDSTRSLVWSTAKDLPYSPETTT
ncbi:MAG: hypothetical protein Q9M27_04825 [Mariprofundaceae bacterium]|nr:hypothetical protein [Mariprofundaceae bacterium]